MPLLTSFFERLVFLKWSKAPGPILDLFGATAYKAVSVAVKLGVFRALSDGPLGSGEIAHSIPGDKRMLTALLDTLVTLGYVNKEDGKYSNTKMTAKWLEPKSPSSLEGMFGFFDDMLRRWDYLDTTIRQGKPPLLAGEWVDQHPGAWDRYHGGMRAVASLCLDEVISRVKIPSNARNLIDIGGSHGLYSCGFCRRYPQLSATVFDTDEARVMAEETISEQGMKDRVSFNSGDFMADDLGSGYDVALLFSVIRIFPAERVVELFLKIAQAIETGGQIIIMDHLTTRASSPLTQANIHLIHLELLNSTEGQIHTESEVARMLAAAGFDDVRVIRMRRAPGLVIVSAQKNAQ
ncbi:MAG: methyltransferase domain-containing protein [Deltaproteobacteria bacterium]|nr:methyltransferase domain-containing protein [Deltaproteobacteria bacterium]